MTFPADPTLREPKGDHNRRLSLGIEIEDFAAVAGLTAQQVHAYEMTDPDQDFDTIVAALYGDALERLEADPPPTQLVRN